MRLLSPTSAFLFLASSLLAQSGPGVLQTSTISTAFSSLTGLRQVSMERLPGDAPGTWTACITQGSTGVTIGTYDQVNETFTPNTQATAISFAGAFGLMLEPRLGRYAVFERPGSAVYFAARTQAGVNFTTSAQVAGLSGVYDPAIGYVGGALKLFYILNSAGSQVLMVDLDVTNPLSPRVVGTPVPVAAPTSSSFTMHSPTPITGPDGDVEGFLLAETPDKILFKPGLDPTVPAIVVSNGPGWLNNGGVAGGRLVFANNGGPIRHVEAAWLLGDVVAPGGTVDILGAISKPAAPAITSIVLSVGVTAPISLPPPFNIGQLALDLRLLLNLGGMTHADASQLASFQFPMPNDPSLSGANAAIQGLSFIPVTGTLAFTNTAWINVR